MRRAPASLLPLLLAWLLAWGGLPVCGFAAEPETQVQPAERVRLRSGREIEVASVRVLADRLNVSVEADGTVSRVDLLFTRIDPSSLLRVVDAHSDPKDAQAWLRSARLAFAGGLHEHAALRFIEAARLDPTLRSAQKEGLAAIRRAAARAGLEDLEQRLRAGRDPRGAALLADAILDSVHAAELTAAQRRHVEALGALARRLVQRELERSASAQSASAQSAAAQNEAQEPASPQAGGVPAGQKENKVDPPSPLDAMPDGPVESESKELASLRARLTKATHAREAAADPLVAQDDALRYLEIAARELLAGRRAAHKVRAEALNAAEARELEDIGLDLRYLLLSTYLELADLYRQRGFFDEARARVRAVLLLDPGNEAAWSQRHLIEDDLRRVSEPREDPYRYTIRSAAFFGWYSPSPFYGYGCGLPLRAVPYARGGSFFGYRGGGVPRAVPYRRATGRRR